MNRLSGSLVASANCSLPLPCATGVGLGQREDVLATPSLMLPTLLEQLMVAEAMAAGGWDTN